jgi:hypothetical protein
MLAAPGQWLIQLDAFLPVPLRPGVFIAIVIALLWFVFVRRGLPSLWRSVCRGGAVVLDGVIGVALLPEYLVTSSRRRRGVSPGIVTQLLSPFSEFALARAAALYRYGLPSTEREANGSPGSTNDASPKAAKSTGTRPSRRLPWFWCCLAVAVFGAYCIIMEELPSTDRAKLTFAEGFEYWRDVEAWANVDEARRAAPGEKIAPTIIGTSYHPRIAHVAVGCPHGVPCDGELTVRTTTGGIVASLPVSLNANSKAVVTISLPRLRPGTLRRLHMDSETE